MSKITLLAECPINGFSIVRIELVEANETPATIRILWPAKATVLHPRRFPTAAEAVSRTFATAAIRLAAINRERRL
jgi:hypothetical protein